MLTCLKHVAEALHLLFLFRCGVGESVLRNVDDRSSIHRLTRLPVVVDIVIDINVLFLGGVRESERERLEEMVLGSVRESERPRVSLEEMIEVHLAHGEKQK